MQTPYDDTDEDALQFYNLYARIVIGWSRIERLLDLTLRSARTFSKRDGLAIVSWTTKLREFRRICAAADDSVINKERLARVVTELATSAVTRHTLVHGYYHGIIPNSDPPTVHFTAARYNPSEPEMREVRATHDEMFEFLKTVRWLDFETLGLFMAVRTSLPRTGRGEGPEPGS